MQPSFFICDYGSDYDFCMCVSSQEPHPVRLSQEEVEKRKAQLDSCPLSMFEHLSDLKSFFVEVWFSTLHLSKACKLKHNSKLINFFPHIVAGYQWQSAAGQSRGAKESVPFFHHPGEPWHYGESQRWY